MTTDDATTSELEFHPLANIFPLMEGPDFDELVEDIRGNGLREPIYLQKGQILDGRNRYRACRAAGVEPRTSYLPVGADPLAFVISRNLHRRHLTTQQRGAIAAELATMRSGTRTDLASNDARSPALSDAQAAKLLNVSEPTVERAKARMRTDPEAHAKAKAGTLARAKPKPKTKPTNRQGYTMPEREKKAGPDLLEALGRLVAFTPTSARRYLADNPEEAPKVKHVLASAIRVIDALREALLPPPETEPPLAPSEPVTVDRQMDLEDFTDDAPPLGQPEPTQGFAEEMAGEMPQPNGELRNGYADDPVELGRRVREARKARNWTQGELAEAAGTHAPIVSQIENGKLRKVGKATLQRVTDAVL